MVIYIYIKVRKFKAQSMIANKITRLSRFDSHFLSDLVNQSR